MHFDSYDDLDFDYWQYFYMNDSDSIEQILLWGII